MKESRHTEKYGRLTLPTDLDVIDQTIELKNKLGGDAIRDCDGTDMPQELMNLDAKDMQHIILQEKIMSGLKLIQTRSSKNI